MDPLPPPPPPRPDLPSWGTTIQTPTVGRRARPQLVTAAGVIFIVLGAIGGLAGLVLLLLRQQDLASLGNVGNLDLGRAARGIGLLSLAIGALQVVTGVLVLRLSNAGRILGLVLSVLGLVGALGSLSGRAGAGVIALGLNGLVLYALIAHRDVFGRAGGG